MSKEPRQPLFRLAQTSFKAHPWINVKLCAAFVCLSILICLFSAFTLSMEERRRAVLDNSASSNYLFGETDCSQLLDSVGLEYSHYTVERYDLSNIMRKYVEADVPTVTTNYITLEVNGRKHYFDRNAKPEMLWLYRGNPFNDLDKSEMSTRFGEEKVFSGSFPRDGTSEVLISEKLLGEYGLTEQDVLNKRLHIWLGENADTQFDDLIVVGVISSRYYELSGHCDGGWQIVPSVVAAARNSIPAVSASLDKFYVYSVDGQFTFPLDRLNEIARDGGLIFGGVNVYSQRVFLDNVEKVVSDVYYVVGSILAVGLLLTVMLTVNKFVAVFSRLGGVLLSCGLRADNLYKLLFMQILLVFLASLPIAFVGSLAGYAVISALVTVGTGMAAETSTLTLALLTALSVAVVFVAAAAFYVVAVLRSRGKSVKQMLAVQP